MLSDKELCKVMDKVGYPTARGNKGYGRGRIPIDKDMATALREKGFSYRQIAEYFECSMSTIRRRFSEWNGNRNAHISRLVRPDMIERQLPNFSEKGDKNDNDKRKPKHGILSRFKGE